MDPPHAPPPRESFWITRRVVGVGVASLGVALLGGSVLLGVNANGAKRAYEAGPTRESFDHASSLETWTNVTLVASAVLVAGGIVLVVLPDRDEGRLRVASGPGGAVVMGRF
jgi:hypothetical protein